MAGTARKKKLLKDLAKFRLFDDVLFSAAF